MSDNSISSMAVAAAGTALGLFLILYVVKDTFTTVQTPPCSSRFPSATEFTLKSDTGAPLSAIELQARAGAEEWGVLENAQVVAVEGAPAPFVLKVNLPKGGTSMYQPNAKKGGMSFRWQPRGLEGTTSACLRYSVYIPSGFDFGAGGELPGIYGGADYQPNNFADGINGMAMRPKWAAGGEGQLSVQSPDENVGAITHALMSESFTLPRDRWFLVEQEVVLNTPGTADGAARLWLDGALKVERTDIPWREKDTLTLSGIVNDVWYGGLGSTATAPADTYVALSPATVSFK